MNQPRLFDDTGCLPLFAGCAAAVEVETFDNPKGSTEGAEQMRIDEDTQREKDPMTGELESLRATNKKLCGYLCYIKYTLFDVSSPAGNRAYSAAVDALKEAGCSA